MISNLILSLSLFLTLASAPVHTWWHWDNGEISKEGIRKDLISMKENGIAQATILNATDNPWAPVQLPQKVKFMSEEWVGMFTYALDVADSLGIKIGIHNCDGFATSGGPWITPELSMKYFTWTKTYVHGGGKTDITLPMPTTRRGFYRDAAVIAFPSEYRSIPEARMSCGGIDIGSTLCDGNPMTWIENPNGKTLDVEFPEKRLIGRLAFMGIQNFDWSTPAFDTTSFHISYSEDGVSFKDHTSTFVTGKNNIATSDFQPVEARYFRLEVNDKRGEVAEIELLGPDEQPYFQPAVPNLLARTAYTVGSFREDYDQFEADGTKAVKASEVIDISAAMSEDGKLRWNAPEGDWCIIRFGYTSTGAENMPASVEGKGLECDKMDAEAVKAHFNGFCRPIAEAAGRHTGNTFKFILVDSWECGFTNWTKAFPEKFKQLRGYDITNWIPALCGELVEDPARSCAFLFDFRKTISDLIDSNYYSVFADALHALGLKYHSEIIYGGRIYPPLDILRSARRVDLNMDEFWAMPDKTNQLPVYTRRETLTRTFPMEASLVRGRSVLGSESYTGHANWSETPQSLKPFGDAAFCAGINQIILHSYVHQPDDVAPQMALQGLYGGHFNRNNPWWKYAQGWMAYQDRVQGILQQGEISADFLYYVGDELPETLPRQLLREDTPYGYRPNATDFIALHGAKVADGRVSIGGVQTFPMIVLPASRPMEFRTLKELARLVADGMTLCGYKPSAPLSLAEEDSWPAFLALADSLWSGQPYGKGQVVPYGDFKQTLGTLGIKPDFEVSGTKTDFLYTHRVLEDQDCYFVFNQTEEVQEERVFTFKTIRPYCYLMNAENGETHKITATRKEDCSEVSGLDFEPYESAILIFSDEDIHKGSPAYNGKPISVSKVEKVSISMDFRPVYDAEIKTVRTRRLESLSESEDKDLKYFAGDICYTIRFKAPKGLAGKTVQLNFQGIGGAGRAELNGQDLGTIWHGGQLLPECQLKKFGNILKVVVGTPCRNRFMGDLREGREDNPNIPSNIRIDERRLKPEYPLIPTGLYGDIDIFIQKKVITE